MIGRYTSDAMAAIWSPGARYERWRRVELAVLSAQVSAGEVGVEALAAAEKLPTPAPEVVEAIEAEVRHDVIAFLEAWTGGMDVEAASRIHRNLTSSDIVDTAQACALGAATDLILTAGRRLVVVLADRALEHRGTLCVARTHGQPAALDVVGHRLADFAFAAHRAINRLAETRVGIAVVNISGPVGTGIDLPPELVHTVAKSLGLGVPSTTTQVVFRDSIAAWVADLALIGAVCEAVATEMRLGQHDGVGELAESRGPRQEGSSAMPHKRNPVTAENVTGLARVLRGYVAPAIEDIALWGHRDISHSSVERVVLPDAAALCEHALNSTVDMVEGMVVDTDALAANIVRAGAVLGSSRAQAVLQADGVTRADAAAAVRARIVEGLVTQDEVEAAGDEVIESQGLARMFELLGQARSHCI